MPSPKPPQGYIDVAEAARITGLTVPTVRLAAITGELKGFQSKPKSPWFFRLADVHAWRGMPAPEAVEAGHLQQQLTPARR